MGSEVGDGVDVAGLLIDVLGADLGVVSDAKLDVDARTGAPAPIPGTAAVAN